MPVAGLFALWSGRLYVYVIVFLLIKIVMSTMPTAGQIGYP